SAPALTPDGTAPNALNGPEERTGHARFWSIPGPRRGGMRWPSSTRRECALWGRCHAALLDPSPHPGLPERGADRHQLAPRHVSHLDRYIGRLDHGLDHLSDHVRPAGRLKGAG